MKKVMIFGTFDRLHKGHLYFFRQARKYGDYLIAVIARDVTVEKVKKKLPRENENIRLKNVKKNKNINDAVLGSTGDKYDVIRKHKPRVICLGYDQTFFTENISKEFPKIKIYRIGAYKPKIYKSSLLENV